MVELEERIKKLRDWWWANPGDPRRPEVDMVLRNAYNALENRKAMNSDPKKNKLLKVGIDVFWGDVSEKYEEEDYKEPKAITPELAKKTGLKKVTGGWEFDPVAFKKKQESSTSPTGLV